MKKIYSDETETENDETETIDDEISEDCCPMEIYSDETEPINNNMVKRLVVIILFVFVNL